MKVDTGEIIGRTLKAQGVKHMFGLLGGHIDPIFQGCRRNDIRVIDTRHEAAAGHMAEAWARTTGEPAVAVVTAGPGVANIVTAVANAFIDNVPMIIIGGRYSLKDEEILPLQEFKGLPVMEPITKWSRSITDPARVSEYLGMAFRHATTGRPGPVFLEIPYDVMMAQVEESDAPVVSKTRPDAAPSPSEQAVEDILKMLTQAKRPAIFAGRGIMFAKAHEELKEFAELSGIPVCANGLARGAVSEDSPLGLGGFSVAGRSMGMAGGTDVVLLLGGRLGMYTGGRNSVIPKEAKIIQVDIEGEEIGRMREIELGITADCKETLKALIRLGRQTKWPDWKAWVEKLGQIKAMGRSSMASNLDPKRKLIHPFQLVHEVNTFIKDRGTLVIDGGEMSVWTDIGVTPTRPGRYQCLGYFGCLGTGIPWGLACKLARPSEPVIVLSGDGAVGFNFLEFDTAVRHKIPFVAVIANDQAWGMVKHEQMLRHGKEGVVGSELLATRYDKAAAALGAYSEFVDKPSDILPALERAVKSDMPACINVMIEREIFSPMFGGATAGKSFKSYEEA